MIIFLYGQDSFRSWEKLSQIKNKFLSQDSSGSGLSVLDYGEKATGSAFRQSIVSEGLFSSKKLLVILNAITASATDTQKELLTAMQSKPALEKDTDLVIVFWESTDPKKNNALYKFLIAHSKKQQFDRLDDVHLSQWIQKRVTALNPSATIENSALNLLVSYTGNDLSLIENELKKLSGYCAENSTITKSDVDLLVKSNTNSSIFEAIEAISSGNSQKALTLFHQQLAQGEDPFYILSMYAYQTRNLLKVGSFVWQGNTNEYAIAKLAGLHPFVVKKSISQLRNLSKEKLLQMMRVIQEIDMGAKTGKADLVLSLDTFLSDIAH